MPQITITSETDNERGWTYEVQVEASQKHEYTVTLSWSEYDLWSHGRIAPEKVIKAAFEFLLEREPASAIMAEFDCAIIRRYFPEVDRDLPTML